MTCEEFEELSGAYALDAVTPAERLAAEAHRHFAPRFVLCHSKPKSILPKLGVGTR
jgi:hypothetical protein